MASAWEIQGRDALTGGTAGQALGSLGIYIQGITTGGYASQTPNAPISASPISSTSNGAEALGGSNGLGSVPNGFNLPAQVGASVGASGINWQMIAALAAVMYLLIWHGK